VFYRRESNDEDQIPDCWEHDLVDERIQQLLEREPDLEVVGALSSLAELEKEIAEHQPKIIVIDAPIKKENDLICTKNITSRSPASKVVILSGYDNAEYIHAAHAAGAFAFVSKQDSAETLIHAIRESHRRAKSFPAYLDFYDYSPLTEIELDVLDLIAKDKANSEIGEQLNISKRTVEHPVSSILRKLYVKSRSGAVRKAFMLGLQVWLLECYGALLLLSSDFVPRFNSCIQR